MSHLILKSLPKHPAAVGSKFMYTVVTRYRGGRMSYWSHNCTLEYARGIRKNLSNAHYKVRYFRQRARHDHILASTCRECEREGARIGRLMAIIDGGEK